VEEDKFKEGIWQHQEDGELCDNVLHAVKEILKTEEKDEGGLCTYSWRRRRMRASATERKR